MTSGRFEPIRASEISLTSASGSALGTIGLSDSSSSHFLSTLSKSTCYFGFPAEGRERITSSRTSRAAIRYDGPLGSDNASSSARLTICFMLRPLLTSPEYLQYCRRIAAWSGTSWSQWMNLHQINMFQAIRDKELYCTLFWNREARLFE